VGKKKAKKGRPDGKKHKGRAEALSEVAAMVLGCRERRENLPILADWLEERLGLAATAALLRSPDLEPLPGALSECLELDYFPLGPDVFLWLAQGHLVRDSYGFDRQACVVVGLYAHPEERPGDWAKVVSMVALEEESQRDPQRPWARLVKKHPLVEEARKELAAFGGRG
jgi:hypothetical protein